MDTNRPTYTAVHIDGSYFYAELLITEAGIVGKAPPIVRYSKDWKAEIDD